MGKIVTASDPHTGKPQMSQEDLIREATIFCQEETVKDHPELLGITDGKAIGTYVEHKFKERLAERYSITIGSSASGIDLPDPDINTDIKVTSLRLPQSSCPYKDPKQKIFGLGYNLLIFVYDKKDSKTDSRLRFTHCTFIEDERTADYALTALINDHKRIGANEEDIIALLQDKALPGDETVLSEIAGDIFSKEVKQGYLTISNALQWRLQYKRAIELNNSAEGVINHVW